jgi:transcription elongation GreA/GreB family factor
MMSIPIKENLLKACENFLEARVKTLTKAIADSRQSSWEDTKSSAGDKYETSREMIQGEISQNSRQLEEAQKLYSVLELMRNTDPSTGTVVVGSLVKTNLGNFYIGIPVGMIETEGLKYALISSSSPIGGFLLGKRKGEKFNFHNQSYILNSVE